MTTAYQSTAHTLLISCFHRCVGMEPSKPADWVRPQLQCSDKTCKLCPGLNNFLQDPLVAEKIFDDVPNWSSTGHIYSCVHYYSKEKSEAVRDETHKDKKLKTKVIKTDNEYQETLRLWRERFNGVQAKVVELKGCKGLLGDKYDELMEMRIVKLPKESDKKDMEREAKASVEDQIDKTDKRDMEEEGNENSKSKKVKNDGDDDQESDRYWTRSRASPERKSKP